MDLEPMETCPYDRSHRIRQSRLPWHLTICSKNHQHANMKRCYYNASHVVSKSQFENHLRDCPSRGLAMKSSGNDQGIKDAPHILPIHPNQNEDDAADGWGIGAWGNEISNQTYNPVEAIQNRPIVHAKIGLSKTERKKHRREEKKRFNELMKKSEEQY